MERFLYRLSESSERDLLVLKGANALQAMSTAPHRATRDIDFLGTFTPGPDAVRGVLEKVLSTRVEPDGLLFDTEMRLEEMPADGDSGGFTVVFAAILDGARIPVRIDIGFEQAVTPAPIETNFPTLLDFPAPLIWAYPKETVIAEKLEAMVSLGLINGRLKDYFDIWFLSQTFDFEGELLAEAIRRTFENRGTSIPVARPPGLTAAFFEDPAKLRDWAAFGLRSAAFEAGELQLAAVGDALVGFLMPVIEAISAGESPGSWAPGAGWN